MAKEFAKKFYSSKKWQDCRNAYGASKHWLCERCLKVGLLNKGAIVHHKEWVTPENINDPNITLNWDNLELICRECHEEEHKHGKDYSRKRYKVDESGNLYF